MAPRQSARSPRKQTRGGMMNQIQTGYYVAVAVLASVCYLNSLGCGFVFDDVSAVKDNRDLRPETPFVNLFWNDFWGTPIHKEHSHKSYRPLCVLTFRLNYLISELEPFSYHLINIILHVIVCLLFLGITRRFLPEGASFIAAILFAIHPIHTEAVTGVVGRAEILSSVFFLLAFSSYTKAAVRAHQTEWSPFLHCILFVTAATLCKEQGITVVGVCGIYEMFVVQKLRLQDLLYVRKNIVASKAQPPPWFREMVLRLAVLVLGALGLLFGRFQVMGAQLPVFTRFDNPAAVATTPARQLTYNYLLSVNAWLLLFPSSLCCDWTMGTIPLVESFIDFRNLATLGLYFSLILLVWSVFSSDDGHAEVVIMGLALLVLPFLPASNLFFPVGFVVAERILYTPSMGLCLLVAYGWHILIERIKWKPMLWILLTVLVLSHSLKTIVRNFDWKSEYTLFMAGLKVNKENAKLYNNVGHALEGEGNYQEALAYFLEAVRAQDDDIGAHINVGRTYNNLQMYNEAEESFRKAKALLPRPKSGEPYKARIAPNHLNVFLNLANLISRNKSRLEEADALYRQAISMRADYIQAYINRGDILIKLNRTQEAQEVYERALQFDSSNPDIYYNLGVVYLEQRKATQAMVYFNKALAIDPNHEQALMNSAVLIQESGNTRLRHIAYERLQHLLEKGKTNERVYFNLGMLAMDEKHTAKAEIWFKKAIQIREDFRSALFNLALLLSDSQRPLEAVPFLKQLLKHHPDHVKGLILLGDIYINHMKDLEAAEKCYIKILQMDPNNVQAKHNLCVVYVERGQLALGEHCLQEVASLAPKEEYVQRHLQIVRARLQKTRTGNNKGSASGSKVVKPKTKHQNTALPGNLIDTETYHDDKNRVTSEL
ncbi:transmembrane and TPR repeat-containing protein CG4050-like isoform X1 [Limulus polyphemus]|uniref:dolichyl-phosphate-mannose--protein mannosyltransferase n=2 Tax=Limulus polyphemus TaxID=6850 RepID=A0ABM1S2Y2_LIMPO|nr:transmembrane and TPR repeat-containing protein CG4050-like isoform X1 [Limulus polyphemus]